MKFKSLLIIVGVIVLSSCDSPQKEEQKTTELNEVTPARVLSKADSIIQKSIRFHGQTKIDGLDLSFTFRGTEYDALIDSTDFVYTRSFTNAEDQTVVDQLNNEGFIRWIDGEVQELEAKYVDAYSASVNGVMYFTLLPWKLNDPAVISTYSGLDTLGDQFYHRIKVTFSENGGGEDFEDEFMYWFKVKSGEMDFLAYSYKEKEVGMRFRAAKGKIRLGDVLFQQYDNYKIDPKKYALEDLLKAFSNKKLTLLSEIINEDITLITKE
ncbi:MAG: hypothetical protein ACI9WO_002069 [Sphingobacteriales bacterium]|jgi:hypothetical protein